MPQRNTENRCAARKSIICATGKYVQQKISEDLYRPIDIHYQHGDSSNLVEKTNWKMKIDIEKTLSDLLEYWVNKIS